jgi:molybdopterin converting factor small subunit
MVTVFIPAALREMAGGTTTVKLDGATVRELVSKLDSRFPGMGARLVDAGEISRSLMVSIDGQIAPRGLRASTANAREVHFLPAIGGG